MSVTAADFHSSAQGIAATAAKEIDYRNVVSRTYYAAYHACLPKFVDRHEVDPRIGHSEFAQWLSGKPAGTHERALGLALNFLRQHRNAADYALERTMLAADTKTAFGAYDNVLRLLEKATAA